MRKSPENRESQGIFETFQSIRDFDSFREYWQGWIRPALLPDLKTVLEGARCRWESKKMPPKSLGRGDFVMGTSIFAVFDHLGTFLAMEDEPLKSAHNISRVAERLLSTQDIVAIVANMGRNSLVHAAWPQTAIRIHQNQRAFGLSLGAGSDLSAHDNLHVTNWYPDKVDGDKKLALKLTLNVHALRLQLEQWIDDLDPESVCDAAFQRVQRLSKVAGDPREEARKKYNRIVKVGETDWWYKMQREIEGIYQESVRLGVWVGKQPRLRRDYGGLIPPDGNALERKRSIQAMLLPKC